MENKVLIPEYFSFKELVYSKYAEDNKIDNMPDWSIISNLKYLAICLDDIRRAWGKAIRVTSGYRSAALNKAIGGVKSSHHKMGLAADLQPLNMDDFDDFKKFIVEYFENFDGEFSQVIIEKSGSTEWIHVSFADNRRQIFKIEK